jgi:WD40 repeat protein
VLRLWPIAGGEPTALDGAALDTPVFAPSGSVLAAPSLDHTVRMWHAATGEARILRGHQSWVFAVAFSPDGRYLASAGADRTIRLWATGPGAGGRGDPSRVFEGHSEAVRHLAFAGPDRLVSADISGSVREWDLASGDSRELSTSRAGVVTALASGRSGDLIAWIDGEGEVQLWSRRAGTSRALSRDGRSLTELDLSDDGRLLVGHGLGDHTLVWDTATGARMTLRSHGRGVLDLAISPDGLVIATAESDHTVRLWPLDLPRNPTSLRAWLETAARPR